jgi:hypothetical protein
MFKYFAAATILLSLGALAGAVDDAAAQEEKLSF